MKRNKNTLLPALAMFAALAGAAAPAKAEDFFQMVFHMRRPPSAVDPSVEALAEEIDWLEKHVDAYGSVVAKQPDVWGQARLTRHRQEYERAMYQQLNQFDVYLQGTLAQQDQSFLANAFALQVAAASPAAAKPAATSSSLFGLRGPRTSVNFQANSSTPVANSAAPSAPSGSSMPPVNQLITVDPSGFFGAAPYNPTLNFQLSGSGMGSKIGIEPTLALDQRDRYLTYLQELRRRNEGDDTADSPGYSLNLARIPISIIPGKRTYRGYGAEITLTARAYLSPALLPTTFRNLVINDVVDQLCLTITRCADMRVWVGAKQSEDTLRDITCLNQQIVLIQQELQYLNQAASQSPQIKALLQIQKVNSIFDIPDDVLNRLIATAPTGEAHEQLTNVATARNQQRALQGQLVQAQQTVKTKQQQVHDEMAKVRAVPNTSTRLRQARNPIPPSQVPTVFGDVELAFIAREFFTSYKGPNIIWNDDGKNSHVMYLDVQRYLQAEVQGAYELLARPEAMPLWSDAGFLPPVLAESIRAGRFHEVCQMRENFFRAINHPSADELLKQQTPERCSEDVVKSLAWAILVESALLNRQLIQDMHEIAQTKGCNCMCAEGMAFYLPHPDPATCEAFNEYVRCRWPIHVFALDPASQVQNIGNAFSRRSELQLALSLSFVQGGTSAQDLMKYARQLDTEIQTVDLNATEVGFSHGADTFGWRFYPRLQIPPTAGTLQNFAQTLCGGPKPDADLLKRRIEPGVRDCSVIIIMPSFVPYVTVETRSDWFRLNAKSGCLPTRHKREISLVDTMKLSRAVQSMHQMAGHLCDSQAYRPGDVQLLMNRVHQIDQQLPLQHMLVQVPIEDTLGGYQMFSNGVTDLAPELQGWYGAPGIALSKTAPEPACTGCSSCLASASSGAGGSNQQAPTATPSPCANTNGGQAQPTPDPNQSPGGANQTANSSKSPDPAKLADDALKLASTALTLTTTAATAATNAAKPKSTQYPLPPDCDCAGTTVFLVGNHFSVVDTRVIAGGMCIPSTAITLLSRQVLQVTIPWNAQTVWIEGNEWVDVHLATPYGVTGHLHIPAIHVDACPEQSPTMQQLAATVALAGLNLAHGASLALTFDNAFHGPQAGTINIQCADANACQAYEALAAHAGAYILDAYLYTGGQPIASVQHIAVGTGTPGSLTIDAHAFGSAIAQILHGKHPADVQKPTLSARLYLKSAGATPLPDLRVSTDLPITITSVPSAAGGTNATEPGIKARITEVRR